MTVSKIRDEVQTIPLEHIRGSISSPRHFRTHNLEGLAHSIRQRGVLHPILVRPINSNLFEVVAGERRLLAARKAGLSDVPTRVRTYSDSGRDNEAPGDVGALEDALVENVQRQRLSSLEIAEAVLEIVCLRLGETRAFWN
jgi:ParB family transcriptional regulator, chromosome partitioning protein